MSIDVLTYQIPARGLKITIYRDALLDISDQAKNLSRSVGRISWLQGHILLRAREQCKKRGDWGAFLASVGMKKETAYLLRRIATEIVPEKSDLEYIEMLAIVFPNTYGKHLREQVEAEELAEGGKKKDSPKASESKPQTIVQVDAWLASFTGKLQKFTERELVDSKLHPARAMESCDRSLEYISICQEELAKYAKTLTARKVALGKSVNTSQRRKAA